MQPITKCQQLQLSPEDAFPSFKWVCRYFWWFVKSCITYNWRSIRDSLSWKYTRAGVFHLNPLLLPHPFSLCSPSALGVTYGATQYQGLWASEWGEMELLRKHSWEVLTLAKWVSHIYSHTLSRGLDASKIISSVKSLALCQPKGYQKPGILWEKCQRPQKNNTWSQVVTDKRTIFISSV